MNTLKDIFDQLVEWKELPSYQAERRLDIFFGYFLEKILKSCKYIHTNDPIKILPEFPLVDKENPNGQWKVKTKVANDKDMRDGEIRLSCPDDDDDESDEAKVPVIPKYVYIS